MEKIYNVDLAEYFGYSKYVFKTWDTPQRKVRYEWLKLCGLFIKNGISSDEILNHAETIHKLKAENKELEDGINEYVNKIEALRGITK